MKPILRTNLGAMVITIGLLMMGFGIRHHKELWVGYRIKEVKEVVEKKVEVHPKDDGTVTTGPVRIEYRYFTSNKDCEAKDKTGEACTATGEYQVRDADNKVWMIKFCDPTPDLKQAGTYDIKYAEKSAYTDCVPFINAKPIQEPTK